MFQKYCNEKRAYLGLALITINSFIINLPHFASFVHVTPEDTPTNSSTEPQQTFRMTEFGGGAGGQFYEFWIHCIILILIPWVSVLTMNIMIIRKVSEPFRNRTEEVAWQLFLSTILVDKLIRPSVSIFLRLFLVSQKYIDFRCRSIFRRSNKGRRIHQKSEWMI